MTNEITQQVQDTYRVPGAIIDSEPNTLVQENKRMDGQRISTVMEDEPAFTRIDEDVKQDAETIVVSDTGGKKGQKSIRLHALPWESLAEVGRVYAFGQDKYDDYNFRRGYDWSLSYDALQRHLWAFWNRQDNDKESGLSHLAHAAWHCFTLLFYSLTGRGTDDRPV